MTEIAFEVVNLVGEEDTPNLFHGRLKSAGGSASIEAIGLLDVKVVANQASSQEEIQLCFYAQESMVACIVLLCCVR